MASAVLGTRALAAVTPPLGNNATVGATAAGGFLGEGKTAQKMDMSALDRLVGQSASMQAVKARITKVASSMAPVLIQGESGTGKELVARAIHSCSHRSAGPFVAVNCGAIPENLLEAEFFGARKGAYTGSVQDRDGYFQAANGGTLFLDEIGDLPLAMQSKLLRVIQERMVRPLGSMQEEVVDVRVVSASHKDLNEEVAASRFRQDLYYRLNVIVVKIPALRERLEDLPDLCAALLQRICTESGVVVPELTPTLLIQLGKHAFNGNVRELENILHRSVALSDGGELHFDDSLTAVGPGDTGFFDKARQSDSNQGPEIMLDIPQNLQDYLDQKERAILCQVLSDCRFNRTLAAAKLGMSLRQIRYRIERLNIAMPDSDPSLDTANHEA